MFPTALLAASTLFPSFWYTQIGFGAFGRDLTSSFTAPLSFRDPLAGLDVSWRSSFPSKDPEQALLVTNGRFRLYFDENTVQIDDLVLGSQGLILRSRPPMGESFDLGMGAQQVEFAFAWGDSGRMQSRAFIPATFVPLGFANTDQDDDDRLKYYFRAGAGIGGDLIVAPGSGDLLFAARGFIDYRYTWRAGSQSFSHNRGDSDFAAEVSLGFRQGDTAALMFTLWGTDRVQWDYDVDGGDVTRQHHAAGFRFERREYRKPPPPPPPAKPPPPPPPPRPLAIPGPKDPPPPPPR